MSILRQAMQYTTNPAIISTNRQVLDSSAPQLVFVTYSHLPVLLHASTVSLTRRICLYGECQKHQRQWLINYLKNVPDLVTLVEQPSKQRYNEISQVLSYLPHLKHYNIKSEFPNLCVMKQCEGLDNISLTRKLIKLGYHNYAYRAGKGTKRVRYMLGNGSPINPEIQNGIIEPIMLTELDEIHNLYKQVDDHYDFTINSDVGMVQVLGALMRERIGIDYLDQMHDHYYREGSLSPTKYESELLQRYVERVSGHISDDFNANICILIERRQCVKELVDLFGPTYMSIITGDLLLCVDSDYKAMQILYLEYPEKMLNSQVVYSGHNCVSLGLSHIWHELDPSYDHWIYIALGQQYLEIEGDQHFKYNKFTVMVCDVDTKQFVKLAKEHYGDNVITWPEVKMFEAVYTIRTEDYAITFEATVKFVTPSNPTTMFKISHTYHPCISNKDIMAWSTTHSCIPRCVQIDDDIGIQTLAVVAKLCCM